MFLIAALSAGMLLFGCSGNKSTQHVAADSTAQHATENIQSKALVAYFSATGTTTKAAEEIAKATNRTLYEIETEQKYTDEDLDYESENSRSVEENKNPHLRPFYQEGTRHLAVCDSLSRFPGVVGQGSAGNQHFP